MHTRIVHNAYSPKETVELCSRVGTMKANARVDKMFISAVLAGCLLAFACAVVLVVNSSPWYQENAPGLIRMIGAIVFPFGLVTIVLTGSDLCTASFMYTTLACLHRRISPLKMIIHWVVTFLGNLAGSLFIVAIVCGYGGIFDTEPFSQETISFANKKMVTPGWHMIFLRGIGANWLVCLACFLGLMARELFSKVIGIWWPTFGFVCLGFDHVVANMFFIPSAIWQDDPQINVGYYIWKSMIPTLIGNIVGGGLFNAAVYWYLYITHEPAPTSVDGEYFGDEGVLLGQSQGESGNAGDNTPERKKSGENMV
ncbi:Formate/nitrite transporter [Polychaeton citri CBS 116435]|uniref:Formate/nitrite transporter n=1 Tax=Polychaeton citri CBS 116435 TaxID=1314669 RepID=A0A9P4QA95_9PEZI|nr:Formate/nitrite transporter [Polychaeton citri CBS 116435]